MENSEETLDLYDSLVYLIYGKVYTDSQIALNVLVGDYSLNKSDLYIIHLMNAAAYQFNFKCVYLCGGKLKVLLTKILMRILFGKPLLPFIQFDFKPNISVKSVYDIKQMNYYDIYKAYKSLYKKGKE